MIDPRHLERSARNLLLCLTAVSILCVSCSERRPEQSNGILEGYPPDLVRFLTLEDDSSRARHGREMGIVSLNSYLNSLFSSLIDLPPDRYDHDAPVIFDYVFKVTRVMDSEYGYGHPFNTLEYIQSLPPAKQREILSIRNKGAGTYWDKDLTCMEKLSRIEEICSLLEQLGDSAYVPMAKLHISSLYSNLGDASRSIPTLREAMRGFEKNGQDIMMCQALGVMGSHFEDIGEIDSMIICYEKALDLAMRLRHPEQVSRISTFYAAYYIRSGRLGMAHELLYEAMERCREYGGRSLEMRYICRAMDFYAELGCWDLVAVLLDRSSVLQRLYSDDSYLRYYDSDLHARRADEIRARFEMTRGNLENAEAIFERIVSTDVKSFLPADQIKIYYHWASGLVDNGRLQRAEAICREGIEYSRLNNFEDWEARLLLLEARMEYSRGNTQASESVLLKFDDLAVSFEESLYEERIFRDGLMGSVKLASGDVAGAFTCLISGLDKLVQYVISRDASAHSYLLFEKFESLKSLFHDLVAYSPSLGYGVELYWRQFYRNLGAASRGSYHDFSARKQLDGGSGIPSLQRDEDVLKSVRVLSELVLARLTEQDALHCTYTIHGDEVWLWVVSSGRIERVILDITVEDLREIVSETLEMMTVPPGDGYLSVPSELTEKLWILANIMLPEELLEPSGAVAEETLYITAGGFLGLVPFETFNIGGRGEYVPLLQHRNVVYLRHTDITSFLGGCQHGVIVINTEPVSTVRDKRLFSDHLHEIIGEGNMMAEADANAVKLVGRKATKANLLDMWEDASYIYFATHIFRDSEVPYLVHIPLAEPEEETEMGMRYLDATDIHAADFSRCRLVVLSGCSSGAPYCESVTAGPALGDIFLDSGVGAVVHTNWNVEDESARKLMGSFIRFWCDREMSPAEALCRSRRDAMRDDRGFKHPYTWASYSIKAGFLQ